MSQATSGQPIYRVSTLSGHSVELKSKDEAAFYKTAQKKYMKDFSFDVASDLRALDRLVFLETLVYRYQTYLGSGYDHEGEEITSYDISDMRKALKDASTMAADVQRDLGLTVSQREKEKFESVGNYIENLRTAAKEFGIHRENQLGVALELLNHIFAQCGAYRRSNDHERKKLGYPDAESLVKWIDEDLRAKYDEVDAHFRANKQRLWVGTL